MALRDDGAGDEALSLSAIRSVLGIASGHEERLRPFSKSALPPAARDAVLTVYSLPGPFGGLIGKSGTGLKFSPVMSARAVRSLSVQLASASSRMLVMKPG